MNPMIRSIVQWPGKLWGRVQPGPRWRRAASCSTLVAVAAIGGWMGTRILSREGRWIDIGIGVAIATIASLLVWPAFVIAVGTVRRVSEVTGRIGLGAIVALSLLLPMNGLGPPTAYLAAAAIGLSTTFAFGALAAMTGNGWKASGVWRRGWLTLCVLSGFGGAAYIGWWTTTPRGDIGHLVDVPRRAEADLPPTLTLHDPGARGTFNVRTLTYGSGEDRHRPEFGEDVSFRTPTANAKPFIELPRGWKGDLRAHFWGFGDAGKLPLNARVWYPDAPGPFPLILCVHGNHHMADWSDPGYAYLGETFASRGYVFASIDENFLNGSAVHGGMRGENDARGWLLLKHLELWREWNATDGHAFHRQVDMDSIALIGHSRGGEAVVHAALFNRLKNYPDDARVAFDFGFSIKSVIAIAPVDGQYRPADRPSTPTGINFLVLHGAHDADVSSFAGDRMWGRIPVTGDRFKASVYAYRANHGQFNTVWGDSDRSGVGGLLLNRAALMSGDDQRRLGLVMMGAFLDATLKGQRQYIPLFRDAARARHWLPDTPIVTRYEDPTFMLVTDFEEDVDVTSTTIPGGRIEAERLAVFREGDRKLRGGGRRDDNAVWLGWNDELEERDPADGPSSYTIHLPSDFASTGALVPQSAIAFSLCAADEKPKPEDYSIDADEEDAEDGTGETGSEDDQAKDEHEKDLNDQPLDLSVACVNRDGTTIPIPLSRFGVIFPPLKARITRSSMTEKRFKAVEPVLQDFEIPLTAFQGLDPKDVVAIRFVFDRCPKGVVVLDRVGFCKAR